MHVLEGTTIKLKIKLGYSQYNKCKHGYSNTLADSFGDEPDALTDITTTVIACFVKNIQLVLLLQPSTPGVASGWGGAQRMLIVIVQVLMDK